MPLKVLELFGGIGACTAALKRLGVDIEVVDYVEIDKYACASYNAINGTNFQPQDICKWDKDIEVDFVLHGSPCQDFSLAGRQAGGDEGSGTRSSLMYETIRIIKKLKPKYVIWENVANLLSEKHFHNFAKYINALGELGYASAYKVLNSKDYGIPQNRERVFTVSVLGGNTVDLFGTELDFTFPTPFELKLRLKDMLQDNPEAKYYLSKRALNGYINTTYQSSSLDTRLMVGDICSTICARDYKGPLLVAEKFYLSEKGVNYISKEERIERKYMENHGQVTAIPIKTANAKGYILAEEGDGIDISSRMEYHRGTVQKGMAQTITTAGGAERGVVVSGNTRRIYR